MNGAARRGKDAPSGASSRSVTTAAIDALVTFSEAERVMGAVLAYESFAGILAELALALEEVRDQLREALAGSPLGLNVDGVLVAMARFDEEIQHVQQLAGLIDEEETDAE